MEKEKKESYTIRKATMHDIKPIHGLINKYAKQRLLLPRSLSYMYDNVRDFFVCESARKKLIGCCALHVVWQDLAEVKSLIVMREYRGKNIGHELVSRCIKEARGLGVKRVFALTYEIKFFKKNKFKRVGKETLPAKVWRECIDCPLFPDCEEVAMLRNL